MARTPISEIWADMARRKVQFHRNEAWDTIKLWGLFEWGTVSQLLKSGELVTDMVKENKTIWVRPSKEAWENKIQPLIKKYSLKQLKGFAGW